MFWARRMLEIVPDAKYADIMERALYNGVLSGMALDGKSFFYGRLANPTNDCVAQKICELEGGAAAMLTGSGQAANYYAVFNICEAGDHVVLSSTVYGGTFNLLAVTMKKMEL